ncbi:dehydrogenase/reductase SDR family member 6-like [Styela clava]
MRLQNKKILVTAAAQGIGRASALAFAEEGAEVIATDINFDKLKELSGTKGITVKKLDVTKVSEIEELSREIGRVDVLFNVAGWVAHGSVLDCNEEIWDRSMEINVKSMFLTIRCFLPSMISHGKGNIINMSSVASSRKGTLLRCAYQTSKAAVVGLTKSISADFCSKGIRCNCIQPGTIDTPSLRDRIASNSEMDPEESMKMFQARSPIGRFGKAEEVAKLAVFLASDESDFIHGTEMVIDGAWSA